MAEPDRGAEAVPEAANDASRGSRDRERAPGAGFVGRIKGSGPFGWLLLALGLAAAVLLVVADLSEISYRTIGIGACVDRAGTGVCTTFGARIPCMGARDPRAVRARDGVGRGRRPLARGGDRARRIGVAVLVIALAIDQPKLDDKRGLDALYDDVVGHAGSAFKIELVAGVLLVLAAGSRWCGRRPGRPEAAEAVEARGERDRPPGAPAPPRGGPAAQQP